MGAGRLGKGGEGWMEFSVINSSFPFFLFNVVLTALTCHDSDSDSESNKNYWSLFLSVPFHREEKKILKPFFLKHIYCMCDFFLFEHFIRTLASMSVWPRLTGVTDSELVNYMTAINVMRRCYFGWQLLSRPFMNTRINADIKIDHCT